MCTINRSGGRPYGCTMSVGNGVCGETKTLDIINEFKRLYEEKMHEIDNSSCGDCLQEKIKLQQDWIGDLTEQNEMLVRAVEELEQEATERVKMLEEKLQRSAQCICEVMKKYREHDSTQDILEEPRKRIFNLESDLKNLLELMRRVRDENELSLGGLTFYEISKKELLGDRVEGKLFNGYVQSDSKKADQRNKEQDSTIQCLESKVEDCVRMSRELKVKQDECENLQKNMIDMRQALTEEVASKHDTILKLKRECQELEDRCIQADKQTAFRDDIIKELRKEIKQLKQQENDILKEDSIKLRKKIVTLETDLELIKYEIQLSLECLDKKMKEATETSQTMNIECIQQQLNMLNKSSVVNLYSFMENEIIQLNKLIDIKHNQLQEIFLLNKILIKRLFEVDVELKYLEERADSAFISCLEHGNRLLESENLTLKKDKDTLEKGNLAIEEKLRETKFQVQNLEKEFNNFLQEKQQLKEKYKKTAQQGLCIAEQCHNINCENKNLKEQTEKLKVELEKCIIDKCRLVEQMNQLSRDFNKEKCACKKDEKLSENLLALKEENRSLMQTIDNQRNKIDITSYITQEEVEKFNKTIDELRNTLEESRRLQEVEEKEKCSEICGLNEKIKDLEECLCEANEKIKEKSAQTLTFNQRIKELEQCLCDANEKAKMKYSENIILTNKIQELECCLCDANEQKKMNKEEINVLKNKLKKLEQLEPCHQKNLESNQECEGLRERIKELELCICDVKGKVKLCKSCKHSLRVGFCDNTEVQTEVGEASDEQIQKLIERDELIKFQAETLRMLQQELQTFQERERCNDVQCLESQIVSLKDKLNRSEKKVDELDVVLKNKEDIIKSQKEALNYIEKELDIARSKDAELRNENQQQCLCIQQLKNRISELETSTLDAERRASNLQIAVDLYTNTINVLETTEEKYKLEIENQRTTINNLQEVLVTTKNELDCAKQKYNDSLNPVVVKHVNCQQKLLAMFLEIITENETEKYHLKQQLDLINDSYDKLQELNFNVELEHCNSLQDVDGLDHQLFKYHTLLKNSEDELQQCKCHLKKLIKQKKNFEEVIQYFKQEMTMMAEQLENLQGLLTISHESAQDESNKLMSAYANIQDLNQKLSKQLATAEQKVLLENQMNQINETKINELERLISEKEINLSKHCLTVKNIKDTLSCSLGQNKELQRTISSLTETLCEFQQAVQQYEYDNRQVKEVTVICQNQIECCKEKLTDLKDLLEEKTSELCKIEMAYNNQHRSLKCCQRELKDIKDRQKNKQYYLKCVIEELKDKLVKSEEERDRLHEKLTVCKRGDAAKDVEITRYRKIIGDLKKTLTELNRTLTKKDIPFQSKCNREECKKYIEQFIAEADSFDANDEKEDISCTNCPCEKDFYQTVVDNLKRAVIELKSRLFDSQTKNKEMETELRQKEFQVEEISRTQLEKDKEYNELKQKLMDRLRVAQVDETRFTERSKQFEKELGSLRRELELKTLQLNEVERNSQQLNGSKCVQLACAQEEINVLKEQLNRLLKQHCAINMENQKLHSQSTKMQSTVTNLEEKSQLLKTQVEQYLLELQMVQKEKDMLHGKNQDLLHELRTLQSSYEGQQRYNENAVRSLEVELSEVKKHRDDIYFESKTVVEYFRLWLKEQKKINEYTMGKEKDYCKIIEALKLQNNEHPCEYQQRPFSRNIDTLRMAQESCQSPWSLGSQGTSSGHEESPCRSPCVNDWYSPNYKNDSEEEMEDDVDWVTKVENLAAQVRRTNKMWKHKMEKADLTVSKDSQK